MPLTAASVPTAGSAGCQVSSRAASAEIVSTGLVRPHDHLGDHLRLEIEGIVGDQARQSAEDHGHQEEVNDAAQHVGLDNLPRGPCKCATLNRASRRFLAGTIKRHRLRRNGTSRGPCLPLVFGRRSPAEDIIGVIRETSCRHPAQTLRPTSKRFSSLRLLALAPLGVCKGSIGGYSGRHSGPDVGAIRAVWRANETRSADGSG